jgi:tetratricopeptide (TPR) repeat protein
MTPPELTANSGELTLSSTQRLAERLRRARLNLQLTQAEVAKDLFSTSYVSGVERGQIRPSLDGLQKLADRLQVSVTDLLSDAAMAVPVARPVVTPRDSTTERHRREIASELREARILLSQRKSDEAIALLLGLQTQPLSPHDMARLRWQLATCYNQQGRAEEARRVTQHAIAVAEQADERELAERLRLELGRALESLQNHATALLQYHACLQAVQEEVVRDPAFRLTVLLHLGTEYMSIGELDQALAFLLEAAEMAEEVIRPDIRAAHYWSISQVLASRGDHAAAQRYARRSVAAYEDAGNRRAVASIYTQLGDALARRGQSSEALAQLSRAQSMAAEQHDVRSIAEAQRQMALVYLEQNRVKAASEAAQEALSGAERLGDASLRAKCLLVLARVLGAQKQTEKSVASFEQAIAVLSGEKGPGAALQLRDAYAQFSEYLERQGDSERAFDLLKQAYKVTHSGK